MAGNTRQKWWLPQYEIARLAQTDQGTVNRALSGRQRPSWPTAKRIAQVVGIDPAVIMDQDGEKIRAAMERSQRTAAHQERSDHGHEQAGAGAH